eukprot:127394-Rhodomonas_salina.2
MLRHAVCGTVRMRCPELTTPCAGAEHQPGARTFVRCPSMCPCRSSTRRRSTSACGESKCPSMSESGSMSWWKDAATRWR